MILGGHFDISNKEKQIELITKEMNQPNFWDDIDNANNKNMELSTLKKETKSYKDLLNKINTDKEFLEMYDLEKDSTILVELEKDITIIDKELQELEITTLLNKEFDTLACYLEIHPGAGGTESCDWSSILLRMYERFCEKNGYKCNTVDLLPGEEAGIKSVTLEITGPYAYGYLKGESGVHRLVRISPFNAAGKRQTSFASVLVTPKIEKDIDIDINENDLKIDVYRSSGNGGQGVNTTDSAVRITHLPTKIVVTCQNERSQLKNKETCMKMLKSKLYQLEIENKQKEMNDIKGTLENINFGSQVRNYVLEPYTMVKDVRSNYETTQAYKVLDGDIKEIIESILKI